MEAAPVIRQLASGDLDQAFALSATAGWNQRRDDWAMLLRLAPHGSLAALDGDRVIATAVGIDYGAFGWIAMMLVDPSWRGKGVGARLLERAVEALPDHLPVRLDATPLGRPLYERHGFVPERALTRCVRLAGRPAARDRAAAAEATPRPITRDDLSRIAARDADAFSGRRAAVLEWALDQAPRAAWCLGGDPPGGYCFGRPGRLFDQVGPVVAADAQGALALLDAAVEGSGERPLVADVFDADHAVTRGVQDRGFEAQRPLYRMWRPSRTGVPWRPGDPGPLSEFAIFGPEFA